MGGGGFLAFSDIPSPRSLVAERAPETLSVVNGIALGIIGMESEIRALQSEISASRRAHEAALHSLRTTYEQLVQQTRTRTFQELREVNLHHSALWCA